MGTFLSNSWVGKYRPGNSEDSPPGFARKARARSFRGTSRSSEPLTDESTKSWRGALPPGRLTSPSSHRGHWSTGSQFLAFKKFAHWFSSRASGCCPNPRLPGSADAVVAIGYWTRCRCPGGSRSGRMTQRLRPWVLASSMAADAACLIESRSAGTPVKATAKPMLTVT
jgi:hypothetical protein